MDDTGLLIRDFLENDHTMFDMYDEKNYENCEKDIKRIVEIDIEHFLYAIEVRNEPELSGIDVPIYSEICDGTTNFLLLADAYGKEGIDYLLLGKGLRETEIGKDMAFYKYGETHAKLASLLGLSILRKNPKSKAFISNLGYFYLTNKSMREKLFVRCLLHSKMFQALTRRAIEGNCKMNDLLYFFSDKTKIRRISNIRSMANLLSDNNEYDFRSLYKDIDYSIEEPKNENI